MAELTGRAGGGAGENGFSIPGGELGYEAEAAERRRRSWAEGVGRGGILSACANRACRTGWLHLFRSRSGPIFEGGWSCSPACTQVLVTAAVQREGNAERLATRRHTNRIPLGLSLLERGWITGSQLRQALEAQRAEGHGRLGSWLVRQGTLNEQQVARGLGLQWGCPVLTVEQQDPEAMAVVMPRLFLDAFGSVPLRLAGGQILYLGSEDRPDPVIALALERMLGLRVEGGILPDAKFGAARERMLTASYPSCTLMETASESPLIRVLSKALERVRPVEARLVRVYDCLWLRMWSQAQSSSLPGRTEVEDLVCSMEMRGC